jgi:hypothetical protein
MFRKIKKTIYKTISSKKETGDNMSANNQVIIIEKDKTYEVHENMCIDNEFKPSKDTMLTRKRDLVKAIKIAQNVGAEYGILFRFKKETGAK